MKAHKGQKFIRTFSPRLTAYSTFSLTQLQSSKSKLPSSGNQGLYLTTVWRQAFIHWCKTNSPWTLNKWWSKVEKWWGFPAVCRITPHVPTSVGPNSRQSTPAACQGHSPGPCSCATSHSLCRPGPRDWSGREEGSRQGTHISKQGCFICRNACLCIFIQGSFRQ